MEGDQSARLPDGVESGRSTAPGDDGDREALSVAEAVLRAVAAMARISKRQQAELGVALTRAGLVLAVGHQRAALRQLSAAAAVEDIIPLSDGGILLSVTAAGMERALR